METKANTSLVDWLRLARDNRFSILQKHHLLTHYSGCPAHIYQASYRDLCARLNTPEKSSRNKKFCADIDKGLCKDLDWLAESGNTLICWGDDDYPALLEEISDPPLCLFAHGDLSLLSEPKISVVGSRRPTPAGVKLTQNIARDLARLGIVITSGMALGIDAASHRAALEANAPTIAVMGCGLDIISPARHRGLFEDIAQRGLVLSEFPIAYPASKFTFPQRNRIVSGLSYGVVIVEAAARSGTLITARLAMEQNREVFVVPGSPLNPQYTGSHRLIRQGASLITNAEDVVSELRGCLQAVLDNSFTQVNESKAQSKKHDARIADYPLLRHIAYEPTALNAIISDSGLTVSEVSSMLLILEVEGLVATTRDGNYLRVC